MSTICANCKYCLERKYSFFPPDYYCTHPDATMIGQISGNTYYERCEEFRIKHDMRTKYDGCLGCSRYVEKEPDGCLLSILKFIVSIFN